MCIQIFAFVVIWAVIGHRSLLLYTDQYGIWVWTIRSFVFLPFWSHSFSLSPRLRKNCWKSNIKQLNFRKKWFLFTETKTLWARQLHHHWWHHWLIIMAIYGSTMTPKLSPWHPWVSVLKLHGIASEKEGIISRSLEYGTARTLTHWVILKTGVIPLAVASAFGLVW